MALRKSRHFLVTIMLNRDLGHDGFRDLFPRLDFLHGQVERCPDTGRLHIQAVYTDGNSSSKSAAAGHLNGRLLSIDATLFQPCHVELLSSADDVTRSCVYCTKEETRVYGPFGTPPRTRKRPRDTAAVPPPDVAALAASGLTAREIIMSNPSLWRSVTAIVQLCKLLAPAAPIKRPITCLFIHGSPGAGKTHAVSKLPQPIRMTHAPPYCQNYRFVSTPHTLFFDDLRPPEGDNELFSTILELSDTFVPSRRILFGDIALQHSHFAITSNYDSHQFLANIKDNDRRIAFYRRFHFFITLTHGQPPWIERVSSTYPHSTLHDSDPPSWLTDLFVRDVDPDPAIFDAQAPILSQPLDS